jgi:hypothetical protein
MDWVGLTMNPNTRLQVMDILYDSFTRSGTVARICDQDYEPDRAKLAHSSPENKHKYYLQGINRSTLDRITKALIEKESVMDFDTFYGKFGEVWTYELPKPGQVVSPSADEALRRFINIFKGFHPHKKRVFWRILLIQLCLYKALKKIETNPRTTVNDLIVNDLERFKQVYDIHGQDIDWRYGNQRESVQKYEVIDKPLECVRRYLNDKFRT